MLPNLKKYCKYEYVMYNSVFQFFLKKQFIKIYINNLLSIHYLDNRVIQSFALNVPDEGYSWNVLCAVNLISTFLFYFIIQPFWAYVSQNFLKSTKKSISSHYHDNKVAQHMKSFQAYVSPEVAINKFIFILLLMWYFFVYLHILLPM
jgi:hypothetical protein